MYVTNAIMCYSSTPLTDTPLVQYVYIIFVCTPTIVVHCEETSHSIFRCITNGNKYKKPGRIEHT